jgi:hypothetical protein
MLAIKGTGSPIPAKSGPGRMVTQEEAAKAGIVD